MFLGSGQIASVFCVSLFAAISLGCGDNTCVIVNNTRATSEWNVTFAVAGSSAVENVDGIIVIGGDCDDGDEDCACRKDCDCHARWIALEDEKACEPLVDAQYEESASEGRTLRFHLATGAAVEAPTELLRCVYQGTREPVPSDFGIELSAGSAPEARSSAPALVVSNVSER